VETSCSTDIPRSGLSHCSERRLAKILPRSLIYASSHSPLRDAPHTGRPSPLRPIPAGDHQLAGGVRLRHRSRGGSRRREPRTAEIKRLWSTPPSGTTGRSGATVTGWHPGRAALLRCGADDAGCLERRLDVLGDHGPFVFSMKKLVLPVHRTGTLGYGRSGTPRCGFVGDPAGMTRPVPARLAIWLSALMATSPISK